MKRLPLLGAALLSWSCANPPSPSTPVRPGDSLHVRVLATHDLHGALLPQTYPWSNGRQVGGVAALKAWQDSLEARCKCRTLRLDGGD